MTVREVARTLAVSAATVYRLCNENVLPHTRVLNAIRVQPPDLRAFVARGRGADARDRTDSGRGDTS